MRYRQLVYWSTVTYSVLRQRQLGYFYALGFPKSGTGWLSRLLSDYLGLPGLRLKHRNLPAFSPCVIKMHRFLKGGFVKNRTIYIVRDPRDVAVSYYWHVLRTGGPGLRDVESTMGVTMTPEKLRQNLPALIEYLQLGRCGAVAYSQHINQALANDYNIIKYEDLLTDCYSTLSESFSRLTGGHVDEARLRETVSRHTFEAETGRAPGVAAPENYIRKGVSGDWKNHFSDKALRVLDEHCGETMVKLGYESDRTWARSFAA